MCNENNIELKILNFSESEDKFNWLTNSSSTIETIGGRLVLTPNNENTYFNRGLGNLDPTNNRVNLKANLKLKRPQSSGNSSVKIWFAIFNGNTLLDKFSVYINSLSGGSDAQYFLDRNYKYDDNSGAISLKIYFDEGFENELHLEDLKVVNYKFCEDKLKTYFIIDEFLENAINSVSSAIVLKSWKVNNQENLTAEFFNENNSNGGNPTNDWYLAKADIDGGNRIVESEVPNTFNPFISELGLEFENVAGNFYGQLPTGTTSGSDYGTEILKLGFDKPEILNLNLESKKGAFFINADYSKSFEIVFEIIVNDKDSNVFNSPNIYREYKIKWDKNLCSKSFSYKDIINPVGSVDVIEDGFLSGITGAISQNQSIPCDQSISYDGEEGLFEFTIDFGTGLGNAGIDYNAFKNPDKFEIEWNGQIYSSGYRGSNNNDQALISLGIPQSEINTANPSNGSGSLIFLKDQAEPSTALIRVTAPLNGTSWDLQGICPRADNFTQITWTRDGGTQLKTGTDPNVNITRTEYLTPVTGVTWQKYNQTTDVWENIAATTNTETLHQLSLATNTFRMKALDGNGQQTVSN